MNQLLSGDELYQKRARKALPLLVRQAQAQSKIYYSDLAPKLGMTNSRNLNYVLGYIGQALESLSREYGWKRIPPIQCLVVNKKTGLPGEGIWWFKWEDDFRKWPRGKQRALVEAELQEIFSYPKWLEVLKTLGLYMDYADVLSQAVSIRRGGESERHLKLKEYTRAHPEILQVAADAKVEKDEFLLTSGDSLDVLFRNDDDWIAVEVKSAISSPLDIYRGMFQCVKYQAVIEAYQITHNLPRSVRVILVLEGLFPTEFDDIKQKLGIEVIDCVRPQ